MYQRKVHVKVPTKRQRKIMGSIYLGLAPITLIQINVMISDESWLFLELPVVNNLVTWRCALCAAKHGQCLNTASSRPWSAFFLEWLLWRCCLLQCKLQRPPRLMLRWPIWRWRKWRLWRRWIVHKRKTVVTKKNWAARRRNPAWFNAVQALQLTIQMQSDWSHSIQLRWWVLRRCCPTPWSHCPSEDLPASNLLKLTIRAALCVVRYFHFFKGFLHACIITTCSNAAACCIR